MTDFIFDLDGTVIDSTHRAVTRADGSFSLSSWRMNSTPENVMRDTLLPLAEYWRAMRQAGSQIVVCTARVMAAADYAFLAKHGLHFDKCISRRGERDTRPDARLKAQELSWIRKPDRWVMFDDNDSVREAVSRMGIKCVDPHLADMV